MGRKKISVTDARINKAFNEGCKCIPIPIMELVRIHTLAIGWINAGADDAALVDKMRAYAHSVSVRP